MSDQIPIGDVCQLLIEFEADRLVVLRDEDHLLRRFGQVEIRRFAANTKTPFMLREEADEVWASIEGVVEFALVDRRPGSPSENSSMLVELEAKNPQTLLVPFGVAYSISCRQDCILIRLTTHSDGVHPGDQTIPVETLSHLVQES
jgi:dTDP-4-dehydrorhamnose 3,5-epimerase-like enzyme